MREVFLEFRSVDISYSKTESFARNALKASSFALRGIDFKLFNGECLALRGPSGSGKSTILKSINRLLEIDSGDILIKTNIHEPSSLVSIYDLDLRILRRQVSYMFQRGLLFPHLTVFENLNLPISDSQELNNNCAYNNSHQRSTSKAEIKDRIFQLLADCELDPNRYAASKPRELSGGELQRASLALSLVYNPKLLMLDEPFTGLDLETKTQLMSYLHRIKSKFSMNILLVSHDADELGFLADRVLRIEGGKLV